MSHEEVMDEIKKDQLFYLNSGGGVTFSGGEPLEQWQFVRNLCKQCKEEGISVALDTSGYANWAVMEKVLDYVDLVLYDIKHLDPIMHNQGTGKSNRLILDNARKTANKVRTWLRVPVIVGYNDSKPYINRLGEFAANLGVEKLSLLPYHAWGEEKYRQLGRVYPLEGQDAPSEECIQGLKEIIGSYGLEVTIG
jgi:pyruvate formate lyase activating enzyme